MKLRTVNYLTYVSVPEPTAMEISDIFRENNIEYEIIGIEDIPEEYPPYALIEDDKIYVGTVCLVSHVNAEDVHMLMMKILNPFKYGEIDEA